MIAHINFRFLKMTFNFACQVQACVYSGTPPSSLPPSGSPETICQTVLTEDAAAPLRRGVRAGVTLGFQIFTRKCRALAASRHKSPWANLPYHHATLCNLLTFAVAPFFFFLNVPRETSEQQTPDPKVSLKVMASIAAWFSSLPGGALRGSSSSL